MKNWAGPALAAMGVLVLWASQAVAGIVDSTVTSLGGNVWRFDYTINNTTPSTPFDELTIFFDVNSFGVLSDSTAPTGWDPLLIQPDIGIPADGFFDVLSLAGPLADGASVSGFSVTVTYLGTGTPGAQAFTLIDSSNFNTVLEGRATLFQSTDGTVPEPRMRELLILSIMSATVYGRRRRSSCSNSLGREQVHLSL